MCSKAFYIRPTMKWMIRLFGRQTRRTPFYHTSDLVICVHHTTDTLVIHSFNGTTDSRARLRFICAQHRWRQEQRSEDSKQMAKVISKFVSRDETRFNCYSITFECSHWVDDCIFINRNFPKNSMKLMRPEVMHNEMCVGVVRVWCLHAVDAWARDILFSSLWIHHHV